MPEELSASVRNQCALLLMVSSHRITWRKTLIPAAHDLMQPYYNEIWPLFFRIFNETSHKQRQEFFSDPLVQVLWDNFRTSKAKEIHLYLRKVCQEFAPSANFTEFMHDIQKIEINTNGRILP